MTAHSKKSKKTEKPHRAGYVNIIGRPNVGKSTLSNALVGEQLSVITSKAQTTRHRILGIVNGEDFQLIFSDTPGVVRDPRYKLHEEMNRFVKSAFKDADIMLFVTEGSEAYQADDPLIQRLAVQEIPILLLLNKSDQLNEEQIEKERDHWKDILPKAEFHSISALKKQGVFELFVRILELLPEHPPYFDKDQLTDKPERFFASEIVREKILRNYKQEIPYSVEVIVESFKEDEKIIRIGAVIYANRKSQKAILIGRGGSAIKQTGIDSRKDMERFFGKQIHLELFVKVREGWRDRDTDLRGFGYRE